MKENKEKKNKLVKLPYYLKPLEKTLETMTTSLISYFYAYSQEYYNNPCDYESFLESFHAFMKSNQINKEID